MYSTPQKSLFNENTSLRQKIESKLSTDKKILQGKEALFKKYSSHMKKTESNIHNGQDNKDKENNCVSIDKSKRSHISYSDSRDLNKILKITEKNVLQYQSLQNPNFYGFNEWVEFNKKFFSNVEEKYVTNLWKIMRIINYGDVLIPSGLIFQVSKKLCQKNTALHVKCLKETFNQFLEINNSIDRVHNFRQLKNYLPLEEIQKAYLDPNNKNLSDQSSRKTSSKTKGYSSLKKLPSKQNVFERNFQASKERIQKKNQTIYKSLVEKAIDEECVFRPKINEYFPDKLFIDESLKPSRICHSKERWNSERFRQEHFMQTKVFKASGFDRSILQEKQLDQIPGFAQHVARKKSSESKKRKLQRYFQKPTLVFRHV